MKGRRVAAIAALAVAAAAPTALAWNPLTKRAAGPLRWSTAGPVVWNPDGGPLGKLTKAQADAMVADSFQEWEDVTTSVIDYAQGGQIVDPTTGNPTDVTSANYNDVINADNGQNPIIYDNDRDIFDMLGTPLNVVGFAGVLRSDASGTITKGYAVLQGDWFDDDPNDAGEIDETGFRGMMVHEFGHFSGLGHTSVNHELTTGIGACPPPAADDLETMGPALHAGALTLHADDVAGISHLYPTAAYESTTAAIAGTVFDRDGSPVDGVNVVVRPDTTVCADLYGKAQGMLSGANPGEDGGTGGFVVRGLDPSSGYTILSTYIEDGASYPVTPLVRDGRPDDHFNGANEAWFDPPDDPTVASVVTTGAGGSTASGRDLKVNNAGRPGEVPATLMVRELVDPLPQEQKRIDDDELDSASAFGGTAQAAWIQRFTPAPDELPFRLEGVDIMFWHGSVGVGRAIRILVYTDPTGSGDPANATLVHTQDETVQSLSTTEFNTYDLTTPVTISSGEYYVGAFDLVADPDNTFIKSEDTDTASGRAYDQANSTNPATYTLQPNKTWMVRARGSTIPPEGSVRLTWDPVCNDATVPDQDYGVYEGAIASLGSGADHEPITCSTGKTTSWDVLGPGADRFWLVAPVLADREGSLGASSVAGGRDPLSTCQVVEPDPCP